MACVGGPGQPRRASAGDSLRCSAREGERKREASPRQRQEETRPPKPSSRTRMTRENCEMRYFTIKKYSVRRGDQRIRGRPNRDRRRRGARATLKRARCPPSERRNQHTRVGKKRRCRARTSPCEQHGTWLWSTPWLRMPTTRNSPPHQWPRRTICASGSRDRAPQSGLRG